MAATPIETDEFFVKGEAIYHRDVLPHLTDDVRGCHVIIDIDSGMYEVDEDEIAALRRLRLRAPDARVWFRRVGFAFNHRIRSRLKATPPHVECALAAKRILIADGDERLRETIAEALGNLGAACTVCESGSETLDSLKQHRFDLVISDIRMPDHNGYEIFVAARRRSDALPVILMTGFGFDPHHSIVRATQEGLSHVLFKPFNSRQLIDEVLKAMGDAEPRM